jgi:hypothetical protein
VEGECQPSIEVKGYKMKIEHLAIRFRAEASFLCRLF